MYIANDQLIINKSDINAVRKSENLQSLTVWIGPSNATIELVYETESERDQVYEWLRSELLEK